jgi:hypothetical protein
MPALAFEITDVETAPRTVAPLLMFHLEVTNLPAEEQIQGVILEMQIQFLCPQRSYTDLEKENLIELFGPPDCWGQTLRDRLWTHATATLGSFAGTARTRVAVPCTFDLNLSASRFLHGLEEGDVPLLFLFSGTAFHAGPDGQLQAHRIAAGSECTYKMPVGLWRGMMDKHWPNAAWLACDRAVFDRLWDYKRRNQLSDWDQTLEHLLEDARRAGTLGEAAHVEAVLAS